VKPWYEHLFDLLLSLMTKSSLGPGAVSGSMVLPTGYSREADEAGQRAKIVAYCRRQMGKPYLLGAEVSPGEEGEVESWDCSELTEAAYRLAGQDLPDGAQQQYDATRVILSPLEGDLGFLWSDERGKIGHVMVYAGHGALIHAVGGRGVVEDPASNWEMHPRWRGWRRIHGFSLT